MLLRSGKEYLIRQKGYKCATKDCEWYGYEKTDFKCSNCYYNKKLRNALTTPLYEVDAEFAKKLRIWVESHLIDDKIKNIVLKHAEKRNYTIVNIILNCNSKINKWIDAEFALQLISKFHDRGTLNRNQHKNVICPYIVDWWHITKKNGFNKDEVCYWGRMNDNWYKPTKVPPYWKNTLWKQ